MTHPLRASALAIRSRSHAPYSRQPVGVALGLASGRWVAAPRVESASYPLSIPALQGAWALAAPQRDAIVAAASSRPFAPDEVAFLEAVTGRAWRLDGPDLAAACDAGPEWTTAMPTEPPGPAPSTDAEALDLARDAAQNAVAPASGFRVGAVAIGEDGRWVTGVNVEHAADWTRGLCGERSALVAARAAGLGRIARLVLACPSAPGATPCGGCRQLIAEQAPDAEIVLWTGGDTARTVAPLELLPGAFTGDALSIRAER